MMAPASMPWTAAQGCATDGGCLHPALVIVPKGKGPFPGAIVQHGMPDTKEGMKPRRGFGSPVHPLGAAITAVASYVAGRAPLTAQAAPGETTFVDAVHLAINTIMPNNFLARGRSSDRRFGLRELHG